VTVVKVEKPGGEITDYFKRSQQKWRVPYRALSDEGLFRPKQQTMFNPNAN
jgi:hypothetical protein